jgi:hypothetical protein
LQTLDPTIVHGWPYLLVANDHNIFFQETFPNPKPFPFELPLFSCAILSNDDINTIFMLYWNGWNHIGSWSHTCVMSQGLLLRKTLALLYRLILLGYYIWASHYFALLVTINLHKVKILIYLNFTLQMYDSWSYRLFMKSFSFSLLLEYEISFSLIKTLLFVASMMSFWAPSLHQKIFLRFSNIPQCPSYHASQWPLVWKKC